MKSKKQSRGEWVQDYTIRGALRQGHSKYRWRSNADRVLEVAMGWLIAALMILGALSQVIIYYVIAK